MWQLLLVLQPVRSLQQGTATKSQQKQPSNLKNDLIKHKRTVKIFSKAKRYVDRSVTRQFLLFFFRNSVHVLCWSQLNPEYVVENVVGRGVFKLKCGKEELLLYSKDGASVCQEWIQAIQETTGKYKASAATLRKESSRRTPLKRPDLMRLRRESLSQIMMIRYVGHTVQITLIVHTHI